MRVYRAWLISARTKSGASSKENPKGTSAPTETSCQVRINTTVEIFQKTGMSIAESVRRPRVRFVMQGTLDQSKESKRRSTGETTACENLTATISANENHEVHSPHFRLKEKIETPFH